MPLSLSREIRLFAVLLIIGLLTLSSVGADVYVWYNASQVMHITNVRPDWWLDEMDQMDPHEIQPPPEAIEYPGEFVGDNENRKFHVVTCEQIYTSDGNMAIPDSKIVWFQTVDEAIQQGFYACDHCKPDNPNNQN
jgi:hypothetical protein